MCRNRVISAHGIYAAIGVKKCLALSMFHVFTGCDTVSSFSGRGKRTARETWNVFPEVTDASSTVRCGICYGSIGEIFCTVIWQNKLPILCKWSQSGFVCSKRPGCASHTTNSGMSHWTCEESSISGRILLEPVISTNGWPSTTRRMTRTAGGKCFKAGKQSVQRVHMHKRLPNKLQMQESYAALHSFVQSVLAHASKYIEIM